MTAILTAIVAIVTIVRTGMDSRRRSQPSVIAELRPAQDSDTVIDFIVRNVGPTVARDLTVSFDPAITLPEARRLESLATTTLIRRYSRPIPNLAPGQEMSNTYWIGVDGGSNKRVNGEPTPERVTVTVRYRGLGRRWLRDSFMLDLDIVTLTTWAVASDSIRGRINEIAASLKDIASAAKRK
ncbi:hypothetical protein KZI27_14150 [Curtobacterium sp. TC1]|uniref:hypothetical protein n=1 Tax=Curtobacterium sp. TC1 TaxID=2862880 RepID=UPI001C9B31BA|nr:hypothetical protein [Curtobacterium sp. TC1]QZQ54444.1 hypothetical protein KZI27_14150 [Curtobacterium sp. TC1]